MALSMRPSSRNVLGHSSRAAQHVAAPLHKRPHARMPASQVAQVVEAPTAAEHETVSEPRVTKAGTSATEDLGGLVLQLSGQLSSAALTGRQLLDGVHAQLNAQETVQLRAGGLGVGAIRSLVWEGARLAATDGRSASVWEMGEGASSAGSLVWEQCFGRPLTSLLKRDGSPTPQPQAQVQEQAEGEEVAAAATQPDLNVSFVALSPDGLEVAVVGTARTGPQHGRTTVQSYAQARVEDGASALAPSDSFDMGNLRVVGVTWPAARASQGVLLQVAAAEGKLDTWAPRSSSIISRSFSQLPAASARSNRWIAGAGDMGDVTAVASAYAAKTGREEIAAAFQDGRIRIFSTSGNGQRVATLPHSPLPPCPPSSVPVSLAWSPSGELLAVASSFGVTVWGLTGDGAHAQLVHTLRVRAPIVAWSPTGMLAVGSRLVGGVHLVDPRSGLGAGQADARGPALVASEPVACLTWSPEGDALAAGGMRGGVWAWAVPARTQQWLQRAGESLSFLQRALDLTPA